MDGRTKIASGGTGAEGMGHDGHTADNVLFIFTRERLSHRNYVCLSVRHTCGSVKNGCKLGSPNLYRRLLGGSVKLFYRPKFERGHPDRGR